MHVFLTLYPLDLLHVLIFFHFPLLVVAIPLCIHLIGPFDMLLCVGKFFSSASEMETLKDTLKMPIATYILGPSTFQVNVADLPENIHILRSSGTQQIQGGITIGTCTDGEIYPAEDLARIKDSHFKGLSLHLI